MQLQLLKNAIHSLLPGAEQLINMQGTQKETRHAKGREREGGRQGGRNICSCETNVEVFKLSSAMAS